MNVRCTRIPVLATARIAASGAALAATLVLRTGAVAQEVDLSDLASLEFHKTQGEWTSYQGSPGLRVTEPADERNNEEDKLVIIDVPFTDGAIEVELSGEPAPGAAGGARGFVGVAFHVQPGGEAFEAFYITSGCSRLPTRILQRGRWKAFNGLRGRAATSSRNSWRRSGAVPWARYPTRSTPWAAGTAATCRPPHQHRQSSHLK